MQIFWHNQDFRQLDRNSRRTVSLPNGCCTNNHGLHSLQIFNRREGKGCNTADQMTTLDLCLWRTVQGTTITRYRILTLIPKVGEYKCFPEFLQKLAQKL